MEKKICSECKQYLPATIEYFASRYDRKVPTFQSSCRECQKKYRKNHYENNKSKYIKKAIKYRNEVIQWFIGIKSKLHCENCKEKRHWVLDFHHRDRKKKEYTIGSIVAKGSKKKLLQEIKKCIVLCSNCHRDLHYRERNNLEHQ